MIMVGYLIILACGFALLKYRPQIKSDEELMFRYIELRRLRDKR